MSELDEYTPDNGFDRVLSTGMFPSLPLSMMMRLQEDGYAVLPIENDGRSMLQLIQHHGEGELMAQWVSCWDVDPWSEEVLVALETGADVESCDDVRDDRAQMEKAWCEANRMPRCRSRAEREPKETTESNRLPSGSKLPNRQYSTRVGL